MLTRFRPSGSTATAAAARRLHHCACAVVFVPAHKPTLQIRAGICICTIDAIEPHLKVCRHRFRTNLFNNAEAAAAAAAAGVGSLYMCLEHLPRSAKHFGRRARSTFDCTNYTNVRARLEKCLRGAWRVSGLPASVSAGSVRCLAGLDVARSPGNMQRAAVKRESVRGLSYGTRHDVEQHKFPPPKLVL